MDKNQAEIVWRKCLFHEHVNVSYMAKVMKLVEMDRNLRLLPPYDVTVLIRTTNEWYCELIKYISPYYLEEFFIYACQKHTGRSPCMPLTELSTRAKEYSEIIKIQRKGTL